MYINKEKELLFSEYKEIKQMATEIEVITKTQNKLINSLYKIIIKLKILLFIALVIIVIFITFILFSTIKPFKTKEVIIPEQGDYNVIVVNNTLNNSSSININSDKKSHK